MASYRWQFDFDQDQIKAAVERACGQGFRKLSNYEDGWYYKSHRGLVQSGSGNFLKVSNFLDYQSITDQFGCEVCSLI